MAQDVALRTAITLGFARTQALAERIEELQRSYSDRAEPSGAALLLRATAVLVRDVERRLRAHSIVDDAIGPEEIRAQRGLAIADIRTLEQHVGRCLDLVAQPHGRDLDAFVEPVGRLAKAVAPETEVVFRPMTQASPYAIAPSPINTWLAQFAKRGGEGLVQQVEALPPIVRLQYPAVAEAEVTHHLLLGHEIAHLALRQSLGDAGPLQDRLAGDAYRQHRDETLAQIEAHGLDPIDSEELLAIGSRAKAWFMELACDRLAVRMVGPAYFLALSEVATLEPWFYERPSKPDPDSVWNHYPAMAWRLTSTWEIAKTSIPDHDEWPWPTVRGVFDRFSSLSPPLDDNIPQHERAIVERALTALEQHIDGAPSLADQILKDPEAQYLAATFERDVPLVWRLLDDGIAPAEDLPWRTAATPPEGQERSAWRQGQRWSSELDWRSILNVGYLHWLAQAEENDPEQDPATPSTFDFAAVSRDRSSVNDLLRGSVELSEIHKRSYALREELGALQFKDVATNAVPTVFGAAPGTPKGQGTGKLARHEIIHALCDSERKFAITPILDPDEQFGPAAVDVRLGPDLIVARRASGAVAFDAADVDEVETRLGDYQQYIRRPFGSAVYLQPGDFALARTLEQVRLPDDIAAEAIGRSSWGRLGLVIATATLIQPGFIGTVTLELANLGNIPMVLYVGMRIAQLTFTQLTPPPPFTDA
jgi:dCTP deaminase